MQNNDCIKTATSITPCEFPFATEQCPIGYTSTDCINFSGIDDNLTGVLNGEILTTTLNKLVDFAKARTINTMVSDTISISKTENNNGITFGLDVKISNDQKNQLKIGTDGALYAMPFPGELLIDTNTINFSRETLNQGIKADVRYVQSSTINLSSTPSGLKADLTNAFIQRINQLEARIQQLENQ